MKRRSLFILVILTLLGVWVGIWLGQQGDRAEITRTVRQFMKAFASKDLEAIEDLWLRNHYSESAQQLRRAWAVSENWKIHRVSFREVDTGETSGRAVAYAHVRVYLAGDIVYENATEKKGEWVIDRLIGFWLEKEDRWRLEGAGLLPFTTSDIGPGSDVPRFP